MKTLLFTAFLLLLQPLLQRLYSQTVDVSHILTGHTGTVYRASFDAAGTRLITAGGDGTARIWNTADGTELRRLTSSSGPIFYAFLSNDGKEAVTFSQTEVVRWDAETGVQKDQPRKFSVVSAKRMEKGEGIIAATYDGVHLFPFFSSQSYSYTFDGGSGMNGPRVLDVTISGDRSIPLASRFIYYREPGFPPEAPPSYGIELVQFNSSLTTPVQRDTLGGFSSQASINFRPGSSSELGIVYSSPLVGGTVTRGDWRNVLSFAHPQLHSVGFSATGDRVVTLGAGVARIWQSNTQLRDSLTGGVTDVSFSDGDTWMAVSREDGTVTINGTIDTTTAPHPLRVSFRRIDFGEVAVGAGRDTLIPLFFQNTSNDASISVNIGVQGNKSFRIMFDTMQNFQFNLARKQSMILGLRFSPLDSGMQAAELTISSSMSGDELPSQKIFLSGSGSVRTYFTAPQDSVMVLAANELETGFVRFGADDSIVVTESWYRIGNGAIALWDAETGRERDRWNERMIGILPDRERIVTQVHTQGAPIRIRSIHSGEILTELQGTGSSAFGGVLSSDGTRAVVSEDGSKARVLDLQSGAVLGQLNTTNKAVYQAQFSPDNSHLVVGGYNGDMVVWNIVESTVLQLGSGDTVASRLGIFTPDGSRVVSGSHSHNAIIFWDVLTGAIVATLTGHTRLAFPVGFNPDGTRLLTVSEDGTAKVWDVAAGTELFSLVGDGSAIQLAAYSPDGYRIVTQGGTEGEFHVWSALTGELLKSVPHVAPAKQRASVLEYRSSTVGFSSDGSRLGIASRTGDAVIFGPSVAMPYIVPDVDAVDLSSTSVGSAQEVDVEFLNRGPVPLELTPRFLPATDGFTLPDGETAFTIGPNERRTLRVRYAPSRTERKDDTSPLSADHVAAYLTLQYGQSGAIAHVRLQGRASGTVGVEDEKVTGLRSSALQIAPNPAGERVRISFVVRSAGLCRLSLVDERGETVREVLNGGVNAGEHSIEFNAEGLPGGGYFVLLQTEEGQDVQPLRLIR